MIVSTTTDILAAVEARGQEYGRSDACNGRSVLVEFVSANPHGPITVENGRCGVVGDVLSKLLEASGCRVTREYYVNDVLNTVQMENLGRSLEVRYLQALGHDVHLPDDGYQGDYVATIARKMVERDGDRHVHLPRRERVQLFTKTGEEEMLQWHKADLDALGVRFDSWYSESALFSSSKVNDALDELKRRGYAYEKGGALWLKSTEFGDEVDRPLVRKGGQPTYIASDAAYHKDKFDRGFDELINVWGPQHQTYVVRTRAVVQALGYDPERLHVLIHQNVRLFSGGEQVMMAKRRGEFVALDKLVEEVGRDATRFFLLSRPADEPLDFDLDLARLESFENPLYSSQQAYIRAVRILNLAEQDGFEIPSLKDEDASALNSPQEQWLVGKLGEYPEVLKTAADQRAPHLLTAYTAELAAAFNAFYKEFQSGTDGTMHGPRLILVKSARTVLGSAFSLLGLRTPER